MSDFLAKPFSAIACCALLAACGGVPASNQLQFDNDGNGRFSGSAGADWTAQEINTFAAEQICGNGPVGDFSIRVLPSAPDYKIFSGTCVSGEYGVAATGAGQNNVVTAPSAQAVHAAPAAAPRGNDADWDGSTPFVD